MTIREIIQGIQDVGTAVAAGDYRTADQRVIDVHQGVHDLAFGAGMRALPPAERQEIEAAVAGAQQAVATKQREMGVGAAPVGQLGDGKILELIAKLLPLILSLV